MSQSNSLSTIAAIVIILAANRAIAFQDAPFPQPPNESVTKYSDWLSADAEEFKIRLDVFMPNGDPASEFSARLTKAKGGKVLLPSLPIEGNRVTATLRNLDYGAPGVIELATNDGRFMTQVFIDGHLLRGIGRNGLKVTFEPVRIVEVTVVDGKGQPIGDAIVNGITQTDENGIAHLSFPQSVPLGFLAVVAPNGKVAKLDSRMKKWNETKFATACRITVDKQGLKQTIRIVDDKGNPFSNQQISISPQPTGTTPVFVQPYPVATDDKGELTVYWMDKLPSEITRVVVSSPDWQPADQTRTPDLWTVQLEQIPRKKIKGKVILPENTQAGFQVRLQSPDHPIDNRNDVRHCHVDAGGNFEADVIHGANYGVYVVDERWASSCWTGVLVGEGGAVESPELKLIPGEPLRIKATVGQNKLPMPNTRIWLRGEHPLKNTTRSVGPSWGVTTDGQGIAEAYVVPGPLSVSISEPEYNDRKRITIEKGKMNEITFHRAMGSPKLIAGKLITGNLKASDSATVIVHAVDGKSRFETTTDVKNGVFEIKAEGERLGVLAISDDQKTAGFTFIDVGNSESIAVPMKPTGVFRGKLMDRKGKPVASATICMNHRFLDRQAARPSRARLVEDRQATTDANGNFEFTGVPVGLPIVLRVADAEDPNKTINYLGTHALFSSVERPRQTFYSTPSAGGEQGNLADSVKGLFKKSSTLNAPALVIIHGSGDGVSEFSRTQLTRRRDRKSYLYVSLTIDDEMMKDADKRALIEQNKWALPQAGQITLAAMDANQNLLGSLVVDVANPDSPKACEAFLDQHRGGVENATTKLEAAFAKAKESNRKLFAMTYYTFQVGDERFFSWLEAHRQELEKEFVFVKIDVLRDEDSREVARRISDGQQSIPLFFAVFNVDGKRLIDSMGPVGNTGYPGRSFEGKQHLRQVLEKTATGMTGEEIDSLIKSLDEFN